MSTVMAGYLLKTERAAMSLRTAGPRDLSPLETVRWRLAAIWFGASAVIFLILIGQSLGGVYGDELQRAWGWALPNIVPTLALMVSVFAADALKPYSEGTAVRKNFYLLASGLSVFYLAVFLLSLLAQPLLEYLSPQPHGGVSARVQLLETSNIWLGPLQGLVVGTLGILFFLKEDQKPATPEG
jgi:hypothetical protein